METSDSEYFESADEDFESDYEDKVHQSTRQNVTHKIIEPELCKLKIDERGESKGHTTEKPVEIKKKDDEMVQKPTRNNEETSKSTTISRECGDVKTLITSKTIAEKQLELDKPEEKLESLSCLKRTLDSNKKLAVDDKNTPFSVPQTKIQSDTKNPNVAKERVPQITNLSSETKSPETKQEILVEPEKEEENLWEDEIDWGSEAAKKESQKSKEHSPNSKNEDSGWDDFDAEWESESPASNHSEVTSTKIENHIKSEPSINENLWDDDDGWEPLEKPEEKPKDSESGWGGWGSWGVTSLINTASQGVSTLTTHVSQGLSTVLETGIGIPDPEEMARINKMQSEKCIEKDDEQIQAHISDNSPSTTVGFGLGNFVSGVSQLTKFVESTGTKVITGGLDTLEAIGKKTVEVLQEGDPGLKKKRAFLKLDSGKPNLSQMLREAKEKAEEEIQQNSQKHIEVKRVKNYESLFDDHEGLVHLEALEMLSKLCHIKLDNLNNSLSGEALKDMQETLDQVKELCELPEDEEDDKLIVEEAKETISNAVKEINIPISYEKLFTACEETDSWLANINLNFIDDVELHQQAIDTLAQLTALAVEQFHKAGELLLVKDHRSTADEADSLVQ